MVNWQLFFLESQALTMRHIPFDKKFTNILAEDLVAVKEIYEGWYVEYKAELIAPRSLAKSISSFANHYGGWLFLGVDENRESHTAGLFTGIPNCDVMLGLESVRDASKDLLNPPVFYRIPKCWQDQSYLSGCRKAGPLSWLGCPKDQTLLMSIMMDAFIGELGDSSDPKPEIDRATLDLLFGRGEQKRVRLKSRILRSPDISKGEANQPFVHLSISSDPYEIEGHWYKGSIQDFGGFMMRNPIPFDNIFPSVEGFVARQVSNNPARVRTLTWEFSRHCHSFVTIPISILTTDDDDDTWSNFDIGNEFISGLPSKNLSDFTFLDLNRLLELCILVIARHRNLVAQAEITGPFYVKAYIENVWRTSPFIDLPAYINHVKKYGLPVVQDSEILAPRGTSLDSFVSVPIPRRWNPRTLS